MLAASASLEKFLHPHTSQVVSGGIGAVPVGPRGVAGVWWSERQVRLQESGFLGDRLATMELGSGSASDTVRPWHLNPGSVLAAAVGAGPVVILSTMISGHSCSQRPMEGQLVRGTSGCIMLAGRSAPRTNTSWGRLAGEGPSCPRLHGCGVGGCRVSFTFCCT